MMAPVVVAGLIVQLPEEKSAIKGPRVINCGGVERRGEGGGKIKGKESD